MCIFCLQAASSFQGVCPYPISLSLPGEPSCWRPLPMHLSLHPSCLIRSTGVCISLCPDFWGCHQSISSAVTGQLQLLHWDQLPTILQRDRNATRETNIPGLPQKENTKRWEKGQDQRVNANGWYRGISRAYTWHNDIKLPKFQSCQSLAWYHQSCWELQEHFREISAGRKQL